MYHSKTIRKPSINLCLYYHLLYIQKQKVSFDTCETFYNRRNFSDKVPFNKNVEFPSIQPVSVKRKDIWLQIIWNNVRRSALFLNFFVFSLYFSLRHNIVAILSLNSIITTWLWVRFLQMRMKFNSCSKKIVIKELAVNLILKVFIYIILPVSIKIIPFTSHHCFVV